MLTIIASLTADNRHVPLYQNVVLMISSNDETASLIYSEISVALTVPVYKAAVVVVWA